MANKNRAARFSDFKHGVTVYEVYYRSVRPRTILGRPFKTHSSWAVDAKCDMFADEGAVEHIYLGDSGVRKHCYDNRIPRLYMSRSAALRALPLIEEEQEELNRARTLSHILQDYDPDHDLDWDYDEEPAEVLWERTRVKFDAKLKRVLVHEIDLPFQSSREDVMIQLWDRTYYGSLWDKQLSIDFMIVNGVAGYSNINRLVLVKGVWYIMDDQVGEWAGYWNKSPNQRKSIKLDNPASPFFQSAMQEGVYIVDKQPVTGAGYIDDDMFPEDSPV